MNIALFGGSFDPPHIGHEAIIREALQNLDIDTLFVVPTFLNPFKKSSFASAEKRYKWIQKLLRSYPKAEVLDFEIKKNRPVPTIETIKYLKKKYDIHKIYLIIGADNLPQLKTWKSFDTLSQLVEFIIATREGEKIPENLQKLDIHVTISSTKLREELKQEFLPKSIADEVITYYEIRRKMDKRVEKIIEILDEKKADNIQLFDMREKDYFVDDVIIATTLGEKHGAALLDYLKQGLKVEGESYFHVEPSDEWTVLDMGDILIHLMTPEYRAKYNIEEFLSHRQKEQSIQPE
ncbi:MAG: nicotinate (nicotinamide) nucleotide adenylyltransferase [Epsilonproteobacteria bacterium]|nr:nicotinate (nicotinamide) nucleotide adenylyltransferase [Campylobacterota bacterium]